MKSKPKKSVKKLSQKGSVERTKRLHELFTEIVKIGKEMNKQDNRSTAFPLFVIQVENKRWVDSFSDYDEKERIEETDERYLCDKCKELEEEGKSLPKDCAYCDEDAFDYYKIEQEFDLNAGAFLTAEACDKHIEENDYHYNNPRSYAVSAWRNDEMQTVMKYLSLLAGNKIEMPYS